MKKSILILLCTVFVMTTAFFVPVLADDGISVDFSYEDLSLTVQGSLGSANSNAAIYIVKNSVDTSEIGPENVPVAADMFYISNGVIDTTLYFANDFEHDSYNVLLVAGDQTLTAEFEYLTDDQILARKKANILTEIKTAENWQTLQAVFMGTDFDGKMINDNYSVINPDTKYYDLITNKSQTFKDIFTRKAELTDFNAILTLFDSVTKKLYNAQKSAPSSSTSNRGGSVSASSVPPEKLVIKDWSEPVKENIFSDTANHWCNKFVEPLVEREIINGYSDGTFRPEVAVSRAEFVKMVVTALGITADAETSFSDVAPTDWFSPYVSVAASRGIILGNEGMFSPYSSVTRQDAAVILFRAVSLSHEIPQGFVFFKDEVDIAEYSSEAIRSLAQIEIISGMDDGTFAPLALTSRAQAAALLCKTVDYVAIH